MPVSEKKSFWGKTPTPKRAPRAAQGSAVAYALIMLGNILLAYIFFTGLPIVDSDSPRVEVAIDLIIAGIAGYLTWRAHKRPTLALSIVALAWVFGNFAGNIAMGGDLNLRHQAGAILALYASVGGLRGVGLLRGFQRP